VTKPKQSAKQAFIAAAKAAGADEVAKPPAKAVKKQTQKQRGPR
jgi:hypothetical protein